MNCERQPVSGVHADGGYAEVMIAKANALAAIPDELSPVEAAPLLCAGLTTFNALRKSKARAGDPGRHPRRRRLGAPRNSVWDAHGVQGRRDRAGAESASSPASWAHITTSTAVRRIRPQSCNGWVARGCILATAANNQSMSGLVGGLGPRGEMIVAGAGGNEPIGINAIPLIFGERSIVGTLTGHRSTAKTPSRSARSRAYARWSKPFHSPRPRRPTGE